jgi:hypothetical protein
VLEGASVRSSVSAKSPAGRVRVLPMVLLLTQPRTAEARTSSRSQAIKPLRSRYQCRALRSTNPHPPRRFFAHNFTLHSALHHPHCTIPRTTPLIRLQPLPCYCLLLWADAVAYGVSGLLDRVHRHPPLNVRLRRAFGG